jgi:hypothetical protein
MKAPLLYNFDSDQIDNSLIFGVKFDGKDKNRFIEKIEDVARNFGPEWEQAVRKRREEIIARESMGRKSIDE